MWKYPGKILTTKLVTAVTQLTNYYNTSYRCISVPEITASIDPGTVLFFLCPSRQLPQRPRGVAFRPPAVLTLITDTKQTSTRSVSIVCGDQDTTGKEKLHRLTVNLWVRGVVVILLSPAFMFLTGRHREREREKIDEIDSMPCCCGIEISKNK